MTLDELKQEIQTHPEESILGLIVFLLLISKTVRAIVIGLVIIVLLYVVVVHFWPIYFTMFFKPIV